VKPPRYYALRCFGIGPFPKFYDSFKTLALARRWAQQAKKDGYHTVEILRDQPKRVGYFGIERELVEVL